MILVWITFLTAIAISGVAAWFSVIGLTQIFAAAFLPVAIMGGVLELGKVVAAVWTHHHWRDLSVISKTILVPIVGLLMVVTSLGIFGLLSKGHSAQEMPIIIVEQKVAVLDTQIQFAKDKVTGLNVRLNTLNEALTRYIELGAVSKGLDKTQEDISNIQSQIQSELNNIADLEQQKLKEKLSISEVEAELGPLKYVANLLGETDNLQNAVTIVIFIIIFCFDPLALILLVLSVDRIFNRQQIFDAENLTKLKAIELAKKKLGLTRAQSEKMSKEAIVQLLNNAK